MQGSTWELEAAAAYRRQEAMAGAERERRLVEAEAGRSGRTRRLLDWLSGVAHCMRTQSARMETPRALRQQGGCAS